MNPQTLSVPMLAERPEQPQRSNRRRDGVIKVGLVVAMVTLFLLSCGAWGPSLLERSAQAQTGIADEAQPTKEVKAQGFVLVDDKRKKRGELVVRADGSPALVLYDKAGTPRVTFSVETTEADRPRIMLHQADGHAAFSCFVDKEHGPSLALSADGANLEKAPMIFITTYDKEPMIVLKERGVARIGLVLSRQGPHLRVWDRQGKDRVQLGMNDERNTPYVEVYNEQGRVLDKLPR